MGDWRVSSSDGDYRLCAQWSLGIRLLVAAPGVLAALLLWAVGGYLLISSASDSSMAADEEFASIAALGALVGAVAVAIGLYLAVAAVAVAGKRPSRLLKYAAPPSSSERRRRASARRVW